MTITIPEVAAAEQSPATDREAVLYVALALAKGAPLWKGLGHHVHEDGLRWVNIDCHTLADARKWARRLGAEKGTPLVCPTFTMHCWAAKWRGWDLDIRVNVYAAVESPVDVDAAAILSAALESPAADEAAPVDIKGRVLAFDEVGNRDVRTTFVGEVDGKLVFESEVGFVDGPVGDPRSDVHTYPTMTAAFEGHRKLVDELRGPNWLAPSAGIEIAAAEPRTPRSWSRDDTIPADVERVEDAGYERWYRHNGGWACAIDQVGLDDPGVDEEEMLADNGPVVEVLPAADEQQTEVSR